MWGSLKFWKSNAFTGPLSPSIESEYSKNGKDGHFGLLLKELKTRSNRQMLHNNRDQKAHKKLAKSGLKSREKRDKKARKNLDKNLVKKHDKKKKLLKKS